MWFVPSGDGAHLLRDSRVPGVAASLFFELARYVSVPYLYGAVLVLVLRKGDCTFLEQEAGLGLYTRRFFALIPA